MQNPSTHRHLYAARVNADQFRALSDDVGGEIVRWCVVATSRMTQAVTPPLYGRVRYILETPHDPASRTVNSIQVIANWPDLIRQFYPAYPPIFLTVALSEISDAPRRKFPLNTNIANPWYSGMLSTRLLRELRPAVRSF